MIKLINLIMKAGDIILDWIMKPVSGYGPEWELGYISMVSGIVFLIVYARLSDQAGLKRIKKEIMAQIWKAALYRHDFRITLQSQRHLVGASFRYFCRTLFPLSVLLIPGLFLLSELHQRFSARGIIPGEEVIAAMTLHSGIDLRTAGIDGGLGLRISGIFRDVDQQMVQCRIKITTPNPSNRIIIRLDGFPACTTGLTVGHHQCARRHYTDGTQHHRIKPGISSIPAGCGIKSLHINYPPQSYPLLFTHVRWITFFLIVSMISSIIMAKILKVEI